MHFSTGIKSLQLFKAFINAFEYRNKEFGADWSFLKTESVVSYADALKNFKMR